MILKMSKILKTQKQLRTPYPQNIISKQFASFENISSTYVQAFHVVEVFFHMLMILLFFKIFGLFYIVYFHFNTVHTQTSPLYPPMGSDCTHHTCAGSVVWESLAVVALASPCELCFTLLVSTRHPIPSG